MTIRNRKSICRAIRNRIRLVIRRDKSHLLWRECDQRREKQAHNEKAATEIVVPSHTIGFTSKKTHMDAKIPVTPNATKTRDSSRCCQRKNSMQTARITTYASNIIPPPLGRAEAPPWVNVYTMLDVEAATHDVASIAVMRMRSTAFVSCAAMITSPTTIPGQFVVLKVVSNVAPANVSVVL